MDVVYRGSGQHSRLQVGTLLLRRSEEGRQNHPRVYRRMVLYPLPGKHSELVGHSGGGLVSGQSVHRPDDSRDGTHGSPGHGQSRPHPRVADGVHGPGNLQVDHVENPRRTIAWMPY